MSDQAKQDFDWVQADSKWRAPSANEQIVVRLPRFLKAPQGGTPSTHPLEATAAPSSEFFQFYWPTR